MAVRKVVKRYEMDLDPRKEFKELIPREFLFPETAYERQRIERFWENFIDTVNILCKTRRNARVNKLLRKAVFSSGMEELCKDFSRRNENIKVDFLNLNDHQSYRLVLVRWSIVPNSCRHSGQSFVAEIPRVEREAQAEFVAELPAAVPREIDSSISPFIQVIPMASITEIEDYSVATANGQQYSNVDVPVAHEVLARQVSTSPTTAPMISAIPVAEVEGDKEGNDADLPIVHEVWRV